MFGCDFAEGETNPFKAKKSKSKFVPDPNKCQIFSLANLMMG
jgi:hypothetical protein